MSNDLNPNTAPLSHTEVPPPAIPATPVVIAPPAQPVASVKKVRRNKKSGAGTGTPAAKLETAKV